MPLTRHFYELDEVQSALYYCASRRECKETWFWCHELICSGYSSEAISILFESWLWQRGPFYLRWLLDAQVLMTDTVTESDIMTAAVQLSSFGEWDNSIWAVLMSNKAVDRVTWKTPPFLPMDCDEKVVYLYRALYQGKAHSAFTISQTIDGIWQILREYSSHLSTDYSVCFSIIEQYEDLLGYRSDIYDNVMLCLAVLMLCLSDKKRANSFMVRTRSLQTYTIPVGRKAGRLYAIPSIALYGTRRGLSLCSEYHTKGLYDIEKAIKGCPFWDDVLKEYQQNGKWVSYNAIETFYDLYFPDDIPDEWSKEEKLKSHGQGLLHPGEKMMLHRYVRIHFKKPARLAWSTTIKRVDMIEGCNLLDAIQCDKVEIQLKPVRRKYVI